MKISCLTFSATRRAFLAICAVLLTHSTVFATAINLGEAGSDSHNWAVFTLGGTNIPSELSNGAQIKGDVGLAGSSKLTMSGGSQVVGSAFRRNSGSVNLSNGAQITGGVQNNAGIHSMLSQGAVDAISASNAAWGMSLSAGYPSTINANSSLTLSGSGTVVLKLTDFMLSGGGILTLQGTATTKFIINVCDDFSISNGGMVKLAGGLKWDNVLFNVKGSGSTVSLSGGAQVMSGILLATNRTVSLSNGAQFNGQIIADRLTMSGGTQVNRPPLVSP